MTSARSSRAIYKTKQADAQLRDRGTEAEKQYSSMLEDYKKANEDYKKLVESANDQAVSAEERDKRKKSAEAKVLELNEIEKTLTQFKREKQATFDETEDSACATRSCARSGNRSTIVRGPADTASCIDSSAESINQAPFILFSNGQNDLTDEILSQMNLTAPPGFLDAENTNRGSNGSKVSLPGPGQAEGHPAGQKEVSATAMSAATSFRGLVEFTPGFAPRGASAMCCSISTALFPSFARAGQR